MKFALIALFGLAAQAQPDACNAPTPAPSVTIALPASPFGVALARDGCWLFVSLAGDRFGANMGIAVLKRGGGRVELSRVVPLDSPPAGMRVTHDGKLLIAASTYRIIFLDVARMIEGAADPVLGSFSGGRGGIVTGSIYANVTADDKLLFISEEETGAITVIDLERARRNGYTPAAIIGSIPTGFAPIALTFSPDGKWLYTTSQAATPEWKWPIACKEEGTPAGSTLANPEGAVIVVDVARARTNPEAAVAARIPAGCSPVRMAISPRGDRIFVTARNSNAVLAFDTTRLVSDKEHARTGMVPVGEAPVPIAVIDGGRKVIVGNSNRFASPASPQSLTVLDAAKMGQSSAAVLGVIPAGAFPREMTLSAEGRTLFLTNAGSNSLQMIDVERLPLSPGRR